MATDLVPVGEEGTDYIIVNRNDKDIVVPIRKKDPETGEMEPYHSDPQVRALQLVNEGRLGGAGRGQGRKRKPRAAEVVAEEVRKRAGKIVDALDAGLDDDNTKIRLSAAEMALKIEREERVLQLKEDDADEDNMDRDELLKTLFQLAMDPVAAAQIEAFDLPESAVREVTNDDSSTEEAGASVEEAAYPVAAAEAEAEREGPRRPRAASRSPKARTDRRKPRADGRGAASQDGAKPENPFSKAARRRAAERR